VAPEGYRLRGGHSATRLGQCVRLSVGAMGEGETRHAAWSAGRAMDSIFSFFFSARGVTTPPGEGLGLTFARAEAARLKLNFTTAVAGPKAEGSGGGGGGGGGKGGGAGGGGGAAGEKAAGGVTGMLGRMMSTVMGAVEGKPMDNKLKVSDFDLLKVVGKGAFGKVMLVRKKTQPDKGGIFAMKVLKKSMIIAKGQVEHTASERSILHTIKHPYIVCLRYAFQSDEKLYLITDYYSGGSLFYHLRKARGFSENRARFYAAELLLALSHLHANHIIYRDLKLENVLMDHHGHIALTDFGLSKENVDDVFEMQLSTFCGTAEYIAPELLKGQKYGAAVDWWSFGVLLYEMLGFKTPFFDKNRKLMFYNIINNEPQWQSHFSERATSCLRGLLMKPPTRRLGSGVEGDREIKQHPFFAPIDFEKLAEKKLEPPFRPEVKNILDPKFVPKTYLNEAAHDSFDRNAKGATNVAFSDFTYQPDSVLDG
jgi:serine/threonine protein kinase